MIISDFFLLKFSWLQINLTYLRFETVDIFTTDITGYNRRHAQPQKSGNADVWSLGNNFINTTHLNFIFFPFNNINNVLMSFYAQIIGT